MGRSEHIIVVDDDPEIQALVRTYLEGEDFRVSTARDGDGLRRILAREAADLVILDLVLPGESGLDLTRQLRETATAGIIILTGKGEVVDRIVGLEMGADDYLAKPFVLRELLARVRSVLRRSSALRARAAEPKKAVSFNGWRLDLAARELTAPDGKNVPLTTAEFALLSALASNPNRVLSREQLLDYTSRPGEHPFDRSVDAIIFRVRRKLENDPQCPTMIKTIRGGGYMFTPSVAYE